MVTSSTISFSSQGTGRGLVTSEDYVEPALVTGRTKLAWGAVIAGSLTAISLLILASGFAYAIRLPVFVGGEYGFGAALYGVIVSVIAFFFGGMIVSYLSPHYEERVGLVHGMLAWVLALPLMMGLMGFAGGLFGGYLGTPFVHSTTLTTGEVVVTAGMAWGAFVAMALGLIFAAIGGMVGFMMCRKGVKQIG